MPLNEQAKKGVMMLVGWLIHTIKQKPDKFSTISEMKNTYGEDPLVWLLVLSHFTNKVSGNYNNHNLIHVE